MWSLLFIFTMHSQCVGNMLQKCRTTSCTLPLKCSKCHTCQHNGDLMQPVSYMGRNFLETCFPGQFHLRSAVKALPAMIISCFLHTYMVGISWKRASHKSAGKFHLRSAVKAMPAMIISCNVFPTWVGNMLRTYRSAGKNSLRSAVNAMPAMTISCCCIYTCTRAGKFWKFLPRHMRRFWCHLRKSSLSSFMLLVVTVCSCYCRLYCIWNAHTTP